ncbi:ABC transporter permease [Paenibacillus sp. 1001270B_150601_E10]|uniref:ABC transporter permease n=1 Tax=Paenibacillus sp. 1001270B_150601_E10 TaxID=2787079 RepID=UPI00189FA4E7|nr:ABC transporter permease [Paenibacillus sp. 1001270B_150601_E10]
MNMFIIAKQMAARLLGNKRSWIVLFVVPSLLLSLIMGMFQFQTHAQPTVVYVDVDQSLWSHALIKELGKTYDLIESKSVVETERLVTERKQEAGLYIPDGYGKLINQQEAPKLSVFSIGLKEVSSTLKLTAEQVTREWMRFASLTDAKTLLSEASLQSQLETYLALKPSYHIEKNDSAVAPNLRIAMGMFMIFILYNALNAVVVMKEDKQKTLMSRIYAAPVRSWEISAGYFIGIVLYGTVQLVIVLFITRVVMGIEMGIGAVEQFVLLELFLCAGISIGCMLGACFSSTSHFSNMGFAFVFPTSMIGGCFWPVTMMKPYMQKLSYIVPQRWALDGLELVAAGNSLSSIWLHLVVLCLFTILFLCLGSVVLQPGLKEQAR